MIPMSLHGLRRTKACCRLPNSILANRNALSAAKAIACLLANAISAVIIPSPLGNDTRCYLGPSFWSASMRHTRPPLGPRLPSLAAPEDDPISGRSATWPVVRPRWTAQTSCSRALASGPCHLIYHSCPVSRYRPLETAPHPSPPPTPPPVACTPTARRASITPSMRTPPWPLRMRRTWPSDLPMRAATATCGQVDLGHAPGQARLRAGRRRWVTGRPGPPQTGPDFKLTHCRSLGFLATGRLYGYNRPMTRDAVIAIPSRAW